MALRFFITHQIAKASNDPAAKLNCSVLEGNADEGALAPYYQQAASQLKGILMQRSGKRYGVFSDEQPTVRGLIKDWQRDGMSFQSFSKRLTEHLSSTLDSSEFEMEAVCISLTPQRECERRCGHELDGNALHRLLQYWFWRLY